jgi:hypothetical protein
MTVTITSCNRFDYFKRTLNSFLKYNTYPIKEYIVRDDSGLESAYSQIKQFLDSLDINYQLLDIGKLGQLNSVDLLMSKVKTDFVFHTEEDWEYYREGFIQKALNIWQDDFLQVWIRPKSDGIRGAIEKDCGNYTVTEPTKFSFNPHLRSMKDFIPYSQIPKVHHSMEYNISEFYKDKRTGWLTEGYTKHIGEIKAQGAHA